MLPPINYFALFSLSIVVTKRKNNETYLVLDYAQRNVVHMSSLTEKTFEKFPDILDVNHSSQRQEL